MPCALSQRPAFRAKALICKWSRAGRKVLAQRAGRERGGQAWSSRRWLQHTGAVNPGFTELSLPTEVTER